MNALKKLIVIPTQSRCKEKETQSSPTASYGARVCNLYMKRLGLGVQRPLHHKGLGSLFKRNSQRKLIFAVQILKIVLA